MRIFRYFNGHLLLILILILFVGLYFPSLYYGILQWDDVMYISENPAVRDPSFENLRSAFLHPYFGNYAPLHLLSYAVDARIWGMEPFGFHFTNILLAVVNVALLYRLVLSWGGTPVVATTAAGIFALHPVQVETIAWLSERKSLLAAAFFFSSMIFFVKSRRDSRTSLYWISVTLYALALLSKLSPITIPVLLWIYLKTTEKDAGACRCASLLLPFAALSLLGGAAGIYAQHTGTGGFQWHGGSPMTTLYSVIASWFYYAKNLLFPVNLSAFYPLLAFSPTQLKVLAGLAVAAAYAALLVFTYRRNRPLFFWAAWPAVLILPNMQIIPLPAIMADRYLYLPIAGLGVLAGVLLERALTSGEVFRKAAVTMGTCVLVCLAIMTFNLQSIWRSDRTLWTYTMTRTPSEVALLNLANDAVVREEYREAIPLYQEIVRYYPTWVKPARNLGHAYFMLGEYGEAEKRFRTAIRIEPTAVGLYNDLAVVLMREKRNQEAEAVLSTALSIDPSYLTARINRMELLFLDGQKEAAKRDAEIVLRQDPENTRAARVLSEESPADQRK